MEEKADAEDLGSLAVVIPAFCAASWLPGTVAQVATAIDNSPWQGKGRVLIVDDGSTDDTPSVVANLSVGLDVSLLRQENLGRYRARLAGLEASTAATFVLLCDARVDLDADALAFVASQLPTGADIWNAHVEGDSESFYALLWDGITHIAWRSYYREPRTTSYSIEDFDNYPKGTTCFFAPRDLLLEAFRAFRTSYADLRNANDDTPIIRWVAQRKRVWISPSFRCTYHGRTTLASFVRHSFHRGIVLVDGYLRKGTKYSWAILGSLVLTPFGLVLVIRLPLIALIILATSCIGLGLLSRLLGAKTREAVALAVLLPVFACSYGSGIWMGVLLRARAALRRDRARR
jgi:glycosyltransferase involved in cell wall biosynthesis